MSIPEWLASVEPKAALPTRVFVVSVACEKPVPDLASFISGRTWTIEGVKNVEILEITARED